jgi:hypothetical protein
MNLLGLHDGDCGPLPMSVVKVAVQANRLIELGKSLKLLGNWPYKGLTFLVSLRRGLARGALNYWKSQFLTGLSAHRQWNQNPLGRIIAKPSKPYRAISSISQSPLTRSRLMVHSLDPRNISR